MQSTGLPRAERLDAERDPRRSQQRHQRREHFGERRVRVPLRELLGHPEIVDAVLARDRRQGGDQDPQHQPREHEGPELSTRWRAGQFANGTRCADGSRAIGAVRSWPGLEVAHGKRVASTEIPFFRIPPEPEHQVAVVADIEHGQRLDRAQRSKIARGLASRRMKASQQLEPALAWRHLWWQRGPRIDVPARILCSIAPSGGRSDSRSGALGIAQVEPQQVAPHPQRQLRRQAPAELP